MHRVLIRIAGAARNFLFPNRCLACGSLYRAQIDSQKIADSPIDFSCLTAAFICGDCRGEFAPVQSPICPMCGLVYKSREGEDHLCQNCAMKPKHFQQARACGQYTGALMKAIHRLKYNGDTQLTEPLGRLLFQTFCDHFRPEVVDLILPVPLHRVKFKQRGFNQSFLLIRDWENLARTAGGSKSGSFRIVRDALVRIRPTEPQTGLGRTDRLSNIRNAFMVAKPDAISGKHILLVDDVYTTGATVNECAGVLRKHHAKQVDVLTLARAMA